MIKNLGECKGHNCNINNRTENSDNYVCYEPKPKTVDEEQPEIDF